MRTPSWQSVVVSVLFLGLVGYIVHFCGTKANTFDEFAKYWGLFATIIGVVTGAIPSYFFHSEAMQANARAATAEAGATKAKERAEIYAAHLPPDRVESIRADHPSIFD